MEGPLYAGEAPPGRAQINSARVNLVDDPFSSALAFDGWKERPEGSRFAIPPEYEGGWIWTPSSWLLRTGWRRRGLVRFYEVPGHGDA
ncbi:hypothetical protein BH11MYX1_BH11MYX1_27390 [soil metagenome]